MEPRIFAWDELEWEPVSEKSSRKVVHLNGVMCVMFRLLKGSDDPPHSHPHEQIATLISGRVIAQVGDQRKEIGPLEGYCVPPNVPHKVTVLEDATMIDSFAPIREDFLE